MSIGEILIILLFILLFFGSESIPTLARTLGRGMRQIKDASQDIQREIRKSADKIVEDSGMKDITKGSGLDDMDSHESPPPTTKPDPRLDPNAPKLDQMPDED